MTNWRDFFKRVWGPAEGWAFLAYGGGGKFKHRAYRYPAQLGLLLNDAEELNSWANIWFCPHLFKSNHNRQKENAQAIYAIWADKDGPHEDLDPRPTLCWSTSEGKHQALWLLDDPADPNEAEQVARYLTYKTKSDKGGWHLGKVIRFPGSVNYKYNPPQTGDILWDDGPTYTLDELAPKEKTALEEAVAQASNYQAPAMPQSLPSFTESLLAYGQRVPRAVWDMLQTAPEGTENWSDSLWRLERLLLEAGIPLEHTFVIVKESPWNKYKRDGRPDEHLWNEVFKASLEQGPLRDRPEDLPWATLGELMLYSERPSWLVEDIWMEKNVGWIAGVGKSYKSIISLDLALSVAAGVPFLNKYKIMDPGPVLMVQEEDPIWRVAHRIQVMCEKKGIRHTQFSHGDQSLVIENSENKIPLYASIGGGFLFKDTHTIESMERAIDRYRPKLVVVDPLFMVAAGYDEYKAGEMVEPLNLVKRWRNDYNCAFAIVHHYKKGTGTGMERLYGSMALYAWSENSMFVSRLEGNTVLVDRDIKDALIKDKVSIEFLDIDEDYEFRLNEVEDENIRGPAEQRIVDFLLQSGVHNKVSRDEIAKHTGVTGKTVSKIIKKLEQDSLVATSIAGVGGQLWVTALPQIRQKKSTEVIF